MSKKEVIKSSWVIHISHRLSLIPQQIWNVLLAYAYDNLTTKQIHHLDVRILLSYVGKTRNISHLKIALQQLCIIESYNLINKTGKQDLKQKFSLLASAAIEDGFCKYSFSPALIPQLVNPPSYAKINLLMQSVFKSKYSLAIYELCVDYAGIERTPQFTIDALKHYLGIDKNEYKEFKHFNYKIIKKAILEINQKADLSIAVKFGGKNEDALLWFSIKKKMRTSIDVEKLITKVRKQPERKLISACPFQQLKQYGVSDQKAKEILEIFKPSDIKKIIDELECDIKKICNPAAWLTKMFNTKKSEQVKIIGAKKCNGIDFVVHELKQKHQKFVSHRVQEVWDGLSEDRKNTIDISFEQWMASQDFKFIFSGSDKIFRRIFLEQLLLTPQERNFDEWATLRDPSSQPTL